MCGNAIRSIGLLVGIAALILLVGTTVGGLIGLAVGSLVLVAVVALGFTMSERLAIRAVGARPVSEIQYPRLYHVVRELATDARQPVPRIFLAPLSTPSAFAVGRSPRRAGVCVTAGLLRRLNERELRGVLAHELSHVYHRDALISSITITVATLITWVANLAWLLPLGETEDDEGLQVLDALIFLLVGPFAALAVRAGVSRRREYRADETAAHLTGDPEGLAEALRKIDAGIKEHPAPPQRALLATSHVMIAHPCAQRGMGRLFSAHPPIEERIRRLRAMDDFRL
ncbi:M48 family metalloprotease [Spiractinospora alimapuensis]|uniref:M48 family metalloprotease n=1 Tax=Spiractinospora alimapuensis TaxID=2820884 RepID=UPI001F28429D|nr:M48 family metalloprotease [Spiractinospora alimapuensis]QVQ51006.1 M48 family metalloprotease [Spiractinospora alimapuensis]